MVWFRFTIQPGLPVPMTSSTQPYLGQPFVGNMDYIDPDHYKIKTVIAPPYEVSSCMGCFCKSCAANAKKLQEETDARFETLYERLDYLEGLVIAHSYDMKYMKENLKKNQPILDTGSAGEGNTL